MGRHRNSGNSKNRGCSIALHNCQLIYNASSFISLLGVGAGVIISVCPLIIMTRGDAETPVIPEFYDWFNVPHSQQLGLKPNHFSEKRAPKWILKHFLFKLAIDHPCTSGTRGTSLSPLLASSILLVILGLSWSVLILKVAGQITIQCETNWPVL